jgi:hypothetical protein
MEVHGREENGREGRIDVGKKRRLNDGRLEVGK